MSDEPKFDPKFALDRFRQWHFWWLIVFSFLLIGMFVWYFPAIGLTQNSDNDFPSIPDQVSGTRTIFEITDSEYLNIILKSSSPIEALVSSAPKVISIVIQPSPVSSVQLTLSNLVPNRTYYRYDNSFKSETIFTADNTGSLVFTQNVSQPHHIWIQETQGTIFIPADCNTVGTFNPATNTCILNQDLSNNIEITADNITLDCNNHTLSDGFRWTSFAIYLNNRQNVTVKNCTVNNASNGIAAAFSNNNTFTDNRTNGNAAGIWLLSSKNNAVSGNTSSANGQGVALSSFSQGNTIINNNLSDLLFGVIINQSQSNTIESNTINGHSSTGVHISSFSTSNNIIDNTISNNAFGIFLLNTLLGAGNTIRDNTIRDSANSGMAVGVNSPNTKVFNNNFIDNAIQIQAFR